MKMSMKRTVSLLTSFALLFIITVNSFALTDINKFSIPRIDDYVELEFLELVDLINNDCASFNLDNGDAYRLKLGDGVEALKDIGGNKVKSGIYYYPVFIDGTVKLVLCANFTDMNEPSITIGSAFSKKLNLLMSDKSSDLKYIIDNQGLSIEVHNEVYLLEKRRGNAFRVSESLLPKTWNQLQQDVILSTQNRSSSSHYLDVPIVLQGNNPWCWAASIASIVNYREGKSLSASDVVSAMGGNSSTSGSVDNIISGWDEYGYSVEVVERASFGSVSSEIKADRPVQALLTDTIDPYTASLGHSVVLRSYSTSRGKTYYGVMDPNCDSYKLMSYRGTTPKYTEGGYTWYFTVAVKY